MDQKHIEAGRDPLRILLFTHYFWPEPFRINQIAGDLVAAGAEVTVLTGHPSYPGGKVYPGYSAWRTRREWHPAGYDIVRVPVIPRGSGSALLLVLNYVSFVVSGIVFAAWLLRGRRFDVLFNYCTTPAIQGFIGTWLRFIKGGKLVLWVQDLWPQALSATGFVKSPFLLGLVSKAVSLLYRHSDLILGQSNGFVSHIRPLAGRTPVSFFPNPGEHPPPASDAEGTSLPDKFNVVFAGNLGKAQALETVAAAAEILRDHAQFHFILFGSGSMIDWLEEAIRERDLKNLELPGRVPPDAMPAIYAQASALLLTLVDDELLAQTVPSKLQSYLATGVPIVAAVNGEAADIVAQSGGGLACAAENPEALVAALRRLEAMTDRERLAMGQAGFRFFNEHYEPKRLARELFDTLRELAAAPDKSDYKLVGGA